jgi:superfamily II DNA/RNA helicase
MGIHGKLKTTHFKIFDKFRSLKTTGLLVCTDVMARGIDIADIDWMFQFSTHLRVHRISFMVAEALLASVIGKQH